MLLGVKIKQPIDVIDYDFLYGDWLADVGDTVASATVTVLPATLGVLAVVVAPTTVKVWTSSGTDGETYMVEVTMTSTEGRVKQDELEVRVQEF